MMRTPFLLAMLMIVSACASPPAPRPGAAADLQALMREVMAAETAFAKAMADRDLTAFAGYIAQDAIFQPGPNTLRGKAAILEFRSTWRREPNGEWKVIFDDGTCLCQRGD